jgi:HEAT repeat protein
LKIRALEAADAIDPFSDPELTELLGDSEREVVLAALSMAARRDDSMLQVQVDLLAHADDEIANAALASMPEHIAPKWRPDLERLTQNDDPDVATRARQALLRVVDPGVAAGEDNGADRGTAEAPPSPGDGRAPMPSHEALLEQLNAADDEARIAALQGLYVLAKAEDGDRVAGLLGAANSAAVRKQACLVLGRLQDAHAARSLIDLLKETDDDGLKSNAHWALQRITGETLKPDADVWELWWQRVGKARATSKRRG